MNEKSFLRKCHADFMSVLGGTGKRLRTRVGFVIDL